MYIFIFLSLFVLAYFRNKDFHRFTFGGSGGIVQNLTQFQPFFVCSSSVVFLVKPQLPSV